MLKQFIYIGEATFALVYHPNTGMIYITTIRRHEPLLPKFLEFIKPQHFHVDEWIQNSGGKRSEGEYNPSAEDLFHRHSTVELVDGYPVIKRRTGPRSKLIYRTFTGDVLIGIKDMQMVGWTVTKTEKVVTWKG